MCLSAFLTSASDTWTWPSVAACVAVREGAPAKAAKTSCLAAASVDGGAETWAQWVAASVAQADGDVRSRPPGDRMAGTPRVAVGGRSMAVMWGLGRSRLWSHWQRWRVVPAAASAAATDARCWRARKMAGRAAGSPLSAWRYKVPSWASALAEAHRWMMEAALLARWQSRAR